MPFLSRRTVLLVGVLIGLGLWLVPAQLGAHAVPWDGNSPAYPIALLIAGFVLGFLGPGRPGAAATGLFLGQLLVLLARIMTSRDAEQYWLVEVVMLGGYTFVAAGIGALLGSFLRRRLVGRETERRVSDRRA